jgi:hypothetical protein
LLHHFDWETVPTVSALTRTHHVSFSHIVKLTNALRGHQPSLLNCANS